MEDLRSKNFAYLLEVVIVIVSTTHINIKTERKEEFQWQKT